MNIIRRIKVYLEHHLQISFLIRLLLLFTLFFIVYLTADFWMALVGQAWNILKPFFLGFIVAYVLHPIVEYLENKKIHKKFSIPVLYCLLLVGVGVLIFTLIPLLYNRVIGFFDTIFMNIRYIESLLLTIENPQILSIIQSIIDEIVIYLNTSYRELLLLQLSGNITVLVTNLMDGLILALLTLIISIYMLVDFDKIKQQIKRFGSFFIDVFPIYLDACDDQIRIYVQSVLVLMGIKLIEYTLLYYFIGHPDFILLGFLTAMGLLVPYFGAMIANIVGILTILHLGFPKVFMLILAIIIILSNIDAYIISPVVHSKRSVISPLWILFAVLIGGTIYGVFGIFLAVPALLIIRSIVATYSLNNPPKASE